MLNVMRENLRHLKWVLWIVALSMVLYLGVYFGGGDDPATANWAARVDGVTIGYQQFLQEARRTDETYRRLFGAQYDQIKGQIHVGREAIESLVMRRIMLAEARAAGLTASPDEIARAIRENPNFRGQDGSFVGTERYIEALNRNWEGGVAAFEAQLAEEIAIQKWRDMVTEPAAVTDAELERAYRERNEKAELEYVVVPASSQAIDETVSDADLAAWYEAHQDSYRKDETRKIRYLVIERQAQVAKAPVTDAEVQAFYQANPSEFARPEGRQARHILLRVEPGATEADKKAARAKAEQALARVAGGEDFAAVAKAVSQDPGSAAQGGDLGWFGKGQMVPEFEAAAFGAAGPSAPQLVETSFGFHVLQVTGARPAGTVPLEEAAPAIRRQLEARRGEERARTEADRIRAAIAGPADLATVAQKEGLSVQTAEVGPREPMGALGPSPEFTQEIQRAAPGTVTRPLGTARGPAIAVVDEIVPPAVRPLADVRTQVKTDVLNERARQAALASARAALAASGGDLPAAAARLKAEVRPSGPISPGQGLPATGGASAELDQAVFEKGSVGATGVVPVRSGAILYRIASRQVYDPAKFAAARDQLRGELADAKRRELLTAILTQVRMAHAVEVNQALVDPVKG